MPVLAETVQQLCQTSDNDDASNGDLVSVVLRDPAMTSGVLKIANSAYYNSGRAEITTLCRAIVLLGFRAIRSIGLSLTVINNLLRGPNRDVLLDLTR
jgi:HD-like signal output (HDOD) protein